MNVDAWPPPATPSAIDDEFDVATSLASWTLTGWSDGGDVDPYLQILAGTVGRASIGNGQNAFRPSFLSVQVPATGVPNYLTRAFVPPTNFSVWSRIVPGRNSTVGAVQGTSLCGFFADLAGAPSFANSILVGYQPVGGVPAVRCIRVVAGVVTVIGAGPAGVTYEYVGLQKVGTTFYAWAIDASGAVVSLGTTAFAPATAHAGFVFFDSATVVVGNTLIQSGFVRGYASSNFWPLNIWGLEQPHN